MAEYIEREVALSHMRWIATELGFGTPKDAVDLMMQIVRTTEAADVAPVKRGRWIPYHEADIGWDEYGVRCSVCNFEVESLNMGLVCNHYCPHCGARMDGE